MATVIQLTTAPCTTLKVVKTDLADAASLVELCKGEWEAVLAAVKESKNNYAQAFAEIDVDGEYSDELSGEVTVALDTLFAPVVEPVVVQKPVNNTKPAVKRTPTKQGNKPNKASQVRSMVADNPNADAAQLMKMVADSDIGIPKGKIKDYVIGSIKTVRGE